MDKKLLIVDHLNILPRIHSPLHVGVNYGKPEKEVIIIADENVDFHKSVIDKLEANSKDILIIQKPEHNLPFDQEHYREVKQRILRQKSQIIKESMMEYEFIPKKHSGPKFTSKKKKRK